jgi:hypothetical protein
MVSSTRNSESGRGSESEDLYHAASGGSDLAQIERNLTLSYDERFDQLVRTVAFIEAGRAALARRRE